MTELLLADENLIFTVSLAVMLVIAVLEGVATMIGLGVSEFLETLLPESDIDLDTPDIADGNSLSKLLGWLHVGKVPVLMLFVILLTAFGLIGIFIQSLSLSVTGLMFPGYLIAIPAFLLAMPVVRLSGGVLAKIMPKDETEAVTEETFIGLVATITLGFATHGKPAEAKLTDKFGHTHYLMVEPDLNVQGFSSGSQVLLVAQRGSVFLAIANSNAALQKSKAIEN